MGGVHSARHAGIRGRPRHRSAGLRHRQGQSNDYVRLYKERIKNCKPIGSFINNKFALLTFNLCCDTDDEALAIQGPKFKVYSDAVRNLFAPWIEGKPPRSYE